VLAVGGGKGKGGRGKGEGERGKGKGGRGKGEGERGKGEGTGKIKQENSVIHVRLQRTYSSARGRKD
jgi:hypothetical protein